MNFITSLNPSFRLFTEKINAYSNEIIRKLLYAEDFPEIYNYMKNIYTEGIYGINLMLNTPDRNERQDIELLLKICTRNPFPPLMIDSRNIAAFKIALNYCGDKTIINAVNFAQGKKNAEDLLAMIADYNASCVIIPILPNGPVWEINKKIAVINELYDLAVNRYAVSSQNIFIDPVLFPAVKRNHYPWSSPADILNTIRTLKQTHSDSHIIMGLSNISYGLQRTDVVPVNSLFLHLALQAGLASVIADPDTVKPYHDLNTSERTAATDILFPQTQKQ